MITSSPVLAERDAKDKLRLFRMFKLECSNNIDMSVYLKGAKKCYECDIVYGECAQFQFDKLRDQYSQLGTLAGRACKVGIYDEVDAQFIDEASKVARLSSSAAGMDHFQPLYVFIWHKLNELRQKCVSLIN